MPFMELWGEDCLQMPAPQVSQGLPGAAALQGIGRSALLSHHVLPLPRGLPAPSWGWLWWVLEAGAARP